MEFATWNYRAIGTDDGEGGRLYSFHEVHYDSNGNITAYSVLPAQLVWENEDELTRLLERLREASQKPALELSDLAHVQPVRLTGGE